ncbi:MAG: methyltransferase family protein [Gemmataceae bacterium]
MNSAFAIYFAHLAYWASLGVAIYVFRSGDNSQSPMASGEPATNQEKTAPYSRALVWFHAIAFGIMYWGIGQDVFGHEIPVWFVGQSVVGCAVIALGAALAVWALAFFHSWRFRAKLDEGHRLATGGPFRLFRHPIYMALNMLALGSAIWIPSPIVWIGFVLMVIGSDLRGRAEEKLLGEAFGSEYRDYCARTSRFVPGVY